MKSGRAGHSARTSLTSSVVVRGGIRSTGSAGGSNRFCGVDSRSKNFGSWKVLLIAHRQGPIGHDSIADGVDTVIVTPSVWQKASRVVEVLIIHITVFDKANVVAIFCSRAFSGSFAPAPD